MFSFSLSLIHQLRAKLTENVSILKKVEFHDECQSTYVSKYNCFLFKIILSV